MLRKFPASNPLSCNFWKHLFFLQPFKSYKMTKFQLFSYFKPLFFSYFIYSRVFYPQLTLWQLIQPDLEYRFIVRSQLGPSFSKAPLQVLDYRCSHNPHTYRRTVTPNWYRTHTVPKFSLQSSWITRCMPLSRK